MAEEILKDAEDRMKKSLETLKKELASVRAGRATPALLEKVQVPCYGTLLPVNQVATVTAPEARLLVVQPWDRSIIKDIERAILKSDLGLTPTSDGNVLRITVPSLTQERRNELVKMVRKKGEEIKVAIRNVRREANEEVKRREKSGEVSEDRSRKMQNEIQKLTDKYISSVDKVLAAKEEEIMEV